MRDNITSDIADIPLDPVTKLPDPWVEPTYEDGFADGFARAWQECWELFTKNKGEG